MKMPDTRFFHPTLLSGELILSEEESHHAIKSCRAQIGDSLLLCDGKGKIAEGKILEANPKGCKVYIDNPIILR